MAERPKRKICVVTGSRAEYGLLFWLMKETAADPALRLQLIVTGAHLSPKFGDTWRVIEDDGFAIDARVDIEPDDDTAVGVAQAMGRCVAGVAEAYERLKPDVVVLWGDRYEILAAAAAATIACIPIAHVSGGEVTEGAIDDAIRHAITKMASLHFVAAEPYRARVIQMGEDPARVFTVGAPGLDNVEKLALLDRGGVEKALKLPKGRDYFLVTYHPATRGDAEREVAAILAALDRFPDHHVVATGVNADPGRDRIAKLLADYVAANAGRAVMHESLGQLRYLSALKHAAAAVGNSSSGIVEAPAFSVPTVNIGDRQKGRLRARSVIDCAGTADAVAAAIGRALEPGFRAGLAGMATPFGGGGASARIARHLKAIDLASLARKPFFDLRRERAAPGLRSRKAATAE